MKLFYLSFTLLCLSVSSYGQYWFGPKVGVSLIDHVYQNSDYERDSALSVSSNVNWQAGFALSYSATDMYAVYGEINYERIGKEVTDTQTDGELVSSEMVNHFISIPVMLRISLGGGGPLRFYLNGGPRVAYWVGGSGTLFLDEFEENSLPPFDYNIRFNSDKVLDEDEDVALVSDPNRFQFGLTFGGGVHFELANGSRLQLDARYTWVHSNMANNRGSEDINLGGYAGYSENLEYYNNIASISLAYLMNFDLDLSRKGKSTQKESNKSRKK